MIRTNELATRRWSLSLRLAAGELSIYLTSTWQREKKIIVGKRLLSIKTPSFPQLFQFSKHNAPSNPQLDGVEGTQHFPHVPQNEGSLTPGRGAGAFLQGQSKHMSQGWAEA